MSGEAHPHLSKAPIVEALVDLRVRLPDGFDVEGLRGLHSQVASRYAHMDEIEGIQAAFELSAKGVSVQGGKGLRGFRVRSTDGREVGQFRVDGFTFSRLRPYTTWKDVFGEAWRLWELYRDRVNPLSVTRLATRFVNRIEFSEEFLTEHYFHGGPQVPDGLPDALEGFLYRYTLAPVDGIKSTITLATEPRQPGKQYSVVLDIDCYLPVDLRAGEGDAIRDAFAALREMKNRIFFRTVTERARRTFE